MRSLKTNLTTLNSLLAALLCTSLLTACATPKNSSEKYAEIDADPIEPLNRAIFEFNYVLDEIIVRPLTEGYEFVVPERGQMMVSNAVDNIKEPATFANSILQLDASNSFKTLWRFMINSTVGLAGLFDAATEVGLKNRPTGLGDTFAVYGADSGAYIVIPFIGPSSVRDGIGMAGDMLADPINYMNDPVRYSLTGVKVVDARHRNMKLLNDIYKNSIDPYVSMRSIYTQYREKAVKDTIKARKQSMEETAKCSANKSAK